MKKIRFKMSTLILIVLGLVVVFWSVPAKADTKDFIAGIIIGAMLADDEKPKPKGPPPDDPCWKADTCPDSLIEPQHWKGLKDKYRKYDRYKELPRRLYPCSHTQAGVRGCKWAEDLDPEVIRKIDELLIHGG